MPPVAFSSVLAEFTPLSSQAQIAIWSLLALAVIGTTIWNNIRQGRRQPPIDVDLVKLAGSIDTLNTGFAKLSATMEKFASHAAEIESLQRDVADLRRAREQDQTSQRAYTQKSTREIFERIEGVERSMANNFQNLERSLGRIEGQLQGRSA